MTERDLTGNLNIIGDLTVTGSYPGGGGPGSLTVKEAGSTVDASVTTLDFDGTAFNLTESPEDEINFALNFGTGAGQPAEGNHTHLLAAVTDITASVTEVNYTGGVTSAIQTQLDGKQPLDADLTTIAGLVDPNADRILFWDDSAGAYAYLEVGSGLSVTTTTIAATAAPIQTPGCTWGDGVNTDSITVSTVGYIRVPYAGTISEWCVVANASCTCTIDVWRTSAALPVNGDSIAGTGKPALTAATTAEGNVSLWSSATVTADDVFGFELEALTGTPSAITVTLKVG